MTRQILRTALIALASIGGLLLGAAASAHHSVAAEFDTSNQGELEGEITRVWFTNPHIRYQLTIRRDDGTTEDWELQAGNVTGLQRQGWFEDTIKVGDRVTVAGDFGRGGAQKLRIR
ncbi:MAG: DUF6152 family protein, partial [Gammaproteobacteria bacterium]|nr:DUF6152 family protein [Gammaproteobacteria bacterium]